MAVKLVGLLDARMRWVNGTPMVPLTVLGLVIEGAFAAILSVKFWVEDPLALVAWNLRLKVPARVGTPVTSPEVALIVSPGIKPSAA